jgi:sugar (pentulose or hexulose) kinase
MIEHYLLGIDAGTSVIKSVLFDLRGAEVAVSRRESPVEHPHPNWSEADMEQVWALTLETVREVASEGAGEKVVGIGITGTCCGAWLVDGEGRPVRPAILWNDGRASDILAEWQRSGLMSRIFAISGNAPFPGYTLPVLAWLRRHEPRSLDRARWLLFTKDWIRFKLTGEIANEESDCSYMPFDIAARSFSQELFDIVGIRECGRLLPRMLKGYELGGRVLPEISEITGLPEGTPVVAGLVDVVASTLGAGACRPGQACSIVGTSSLNSLVSSRPLMTPPDVGVQAVMPGGNWLRSLVNTSGTLNIDWMRDVFAAPERARAEQEGTDLFDLIEETIKEVPIGSGGVMYHPYINTAGVVSPFVNAAARAQFFGIGVTTTRADLMRAVYEGVALSMLDAYENMPEQCEEVLLSGGGARSRLWAQMFADATGKRIEVAEGSEFGARGAAMMAGIGAGVYRDVEEAASIARVARSHDPDPEAHSQYRELYTLYRDLYRQLGDAWWLRHRIMQDLHDMQSREPHATPANQTARAVRRAAGANRAAGIPYLAGEEQTNG